MSNLISYTQIYLDRANFRKQSPGDIYDVPGHSFFKILFHFFNGDSEATNKDCGLLSPTWLNKDINESSYFASDTAWAYLKNNYEDERASKLEKFITLLSNISSDCPWYFQEISGIDAVLERKQVQDFKFDEERKRIEIKCLPDSHDQKIGTLLSLYRDIVWSWTMKREVLPANLRKFDMSLFIFESPVWGIHRGLESAVLDERSKNNFSASYKLLEFHNCEFDYNSIKSGFSEFNNREGIQNSYTIGISFDDCYEHTYNHILMESIGDMIAWDMAQSTFDSIGNSSINYEYNKDVVNEYDERRKTNLENRLNTKRDDFWFDQSIIHSDEFKTQRYDKDGNVIDSNIPMIDKSVLEGYKGSSRRGMLSNMIEGVVANAVDEIKTVGNRLLLGNIYTYSISKMASQIKNALKGNPSAVIDMIDDYAGTNIMNTIHNNSLNNLAGRAQSKLNRMVNDRRENSSNTHLGSMSSGIEEPKPAAGKPYQNSRYDKFTPNDTIGHDIFPIIQEEINNSTIGDIFPTVPKETVKTLGNLNKAKTLINNI